VKKQLNSEIVEKMEEKMEKHIGKKIVDTNN
jgi:hypothetical protein